VNRPSNVRRLAPLAVPLALACGALWTASQQGCSNSLSNINSGDFTAPVGLAIAPARDRDLLIMASAGSDELKALTICNTPTLPDGGAPDTTCDPNTDFQFLPGPIRVFPGSFPAGNRPLRIAGVSMLQADGGVSGAVLVAGVASVSADGGAAAQPVLKLIDSVNMVDAVMKTAAAKQALDVVLDAPPIDVVSFQPSPWAVMLDGTPDPQFPADAGTVVPGSPGIAFALTQALVGGSATSTQPTSLSKISVDPTGPSAVVTGRCSLGIVGARLALAPGRIDKVYLSDATPSSTPNGIGDGVLEIDASDASMPAPVAGVASQGCRVLRRFSTVHKKPDDSGNLVDAAPVNIFALALSPAFWTTDALRFPSGFYLVGLSIDGRVFTWRTDKDQAELVSMPPFQAMPDGRSFAPNVRNVGANRAVELADHTVAPLFDDGTVGAVIPGFTVPRAEPLRSGLAREVTFMRTPSTCTSIVGWPANQPCVLIQTGPSPIDQGTYPAQHGYIGAVALTVDAAGTVHYIDVAHDRFLAVRDSVPVNATGANGTQPSLYTTPTLAVLQSTSATYPTLSFPSAPSDIDDVHTLGMFQAGVSHPSPVWVVTYHGTIPGLERHGGTLSRPTQALGTDLRFEMTGVDLDKWVSAGMLAVNDVVSFTVYTHPDGSAVCADFQSENLTPLQREFVITSISHNVITVKPSTMGVSSDGGAGFDPALDCLAAPVGTAAQFRTAGDNPWMVTQGDNIWKGRAATNVQAFFREERFDYSRDYVFDAQNLTSTYLPTPDNNVSMSFTISYDANASGALAIPAGSYFNIQVTYQYPPILVSDPSNPTAPVGGAILHYTSKKLIGGLAFVSLTGANEVLQIDSSLLQSSGGIIAYH
jgi:hypothetical protein